MNGLWYIYKIENLITKRIYIGSSKDIKSRFRDHKFYLLHNNHQNIHLQRSFNKYGIENFKFEILEECSETVLIERETYWLNNHGGLNTTYNIREVEGFKHSEESKLKMSLVRRGIKLSGETKRKLREANLGKKHSEKTKEKIRLATSNRIFSPEMKKQISEKLSKIHKGRTFKMSEVQKEKIGRAHKGKITSEETKRKQSEAHTKNNRYFKAISPEGNEIIINNKQQLFRDYGLHNNCINDCLEKRHCNAISRALLLSLAPSSNHNWLYLPSVFSIPPRSC